MERVIQSHNNRQPMLRSDCRKLMAVLVATWFFISAIILLALLQSLLPALFIGLCEIVVSGSILLLVLGIYREVILVNGRVMS